MSMSGNSPRKRGPGRPRRGKHGVAASQPVLTNDICTRSSSQTDRAQTDGTTVSMTTDDKTEQQMEVGLDIGGEASRWAELRNQSTASSDEEFAKLLLDSWQSKDSLMCIGVGAATQKSLENYCSKVNQSADEVLKFLLRLDVQPGQYVIGVSQELGKGFESVKSALKVKSERTMKHLLTVRDKYLRIKGLDKLANIDGAAGSVGKNIRDAVREEILQLAREGTFTSSLVNTPDYSSGEVSELGVQNDLGTESGKKRRRKSHPHRIVIETDDDVNFDKDDNIAASCMDNGENGFDSSLPVQYNYVLNNGATSTVTSADQVLPLVGSPHVLLPQFMNEIMVQNGGLISSSNMINTMPELPGIKTELVNSSFETFDRKQTFKNGEAMNGDDAQNFNFPEMVIPKIEKDETSKPEFMITKDASGRLQCPYCHYQCMNMTRMKGHCKVHVGEGYKCQYCGKCFNEITRLTHHLRVKHESSIVLQCEYCCLQTHSKRGLKFHEKLHLQSYKYWCDLCSVGVYSAQQLEEHVNTHKDSVFLFICHLCNKKFHNVQPYVIHRRYCTETQITDTFKCDMCVSVFFSMLELNTHVTMAHKELSTFKCACGREFQNCKEFDDHRKNCEKGYERKCDSDGSKANGSQGTETSQDIVHGQSSQTDNDMAEIIDDSSDDSIKVTDVELGGVGEEGIEGKDYTLTANGIYCCRRCSFTTSKVHLLKTHLIKHLGKTFKGFKCPKCPQSFLTLPQMRNHENRRHYNHTRYKCDQCTRTFSSKGGITYHQQTKHGNAYKYKCDTCERGFNSRQNFMNHKSTHAATPRFECERCKIAFSYPSVLKSHRKVCKGGTASHNRNELDLYPCKVCPEKFALPNALQQHVQLKHGDILTTIYACKCGQQFELKALYDLHKTKCGKSACVKTEDIVPAVDTPVVNNNPTLKDINACNQPVFPCLRSALTN